MKVPVTLLCLALAGTIGVTLPAPAQQTMASEKATKETKWQGHVVRIDKDHSMIDINGGPAPSKEARKIAYDGTTEWTKLGKPGKQEELKEDSFVIVMGHVDDKGVLHATRIDLRLPR